ncbi:MAG: bifunctional metallophosphatase/5'-nucleotidase [Solobacterium sp.]|nr:bifunctional metallophosphatase/5'-nucleotidase [Solobacterium sp.]
MKNRIRILATSDVHGYIYPYSYADGKSADHGFARLSTMINSLRDSSTILIDNGDTLEGSPLSYYHYHTKPDQVSSVTKVMNYIGYDYINLGNHDFSYGEEALFTHLNNIKAPCITSNIKFKGKPFAPTYVIRETEGRKVALFALVTQHIPNWEPKHHIRHFRFQDAFETAKKTARLIRDLENPDYVICIYHGGFERDLKTGMATEEQTGENEGYRILKEIPGIDILIAGHQHQSKCGTAFGKAYTETAADGRELACIDIYTDTGIIEPKLIPVDTDPKQAVLDLAQDEEDECQIWLDQTLGTCRTDLKVRDEFDARLHKSQIITFLNMVAKEASGADICSCALFNGAVGFNTSITMRDIVSTYVFPNTLVVKKVTGRILREYLEKNAEFWSQAGGRIIVSPQYDYPTPMHFNYDMADGIEYTIKVSNDPGERIVSLTRNGEEITDDMEFTLCVNNYRAGGGGNFNMIKDAPTVKEIQTGMVELIADRLNRESEISFEPVNNIQVIL